MGVKNDQILNDVICEQSIMCGFFVHRNLEALFFTCQLSVGHRLPIFQYSTMYVFYQNKTCILYQRVQEMAWWPEVFILSELDNWADVIAENIWFMVQPATGVARRPIYRIFIQNSSEGM